MCAKRYEIKIEGKILGQHLFKTIYRCGTFNIIGQRIEINSPCILKSSFAHVTFRLWWVQVIASPSCMIVQICIIPCKILHKILGY